MKHTLRQSTLSLALATGLIGSAAWSTAAHACAVDPYLGAVCIMATPNGYGSFNNTYIPAMGQLLPLNQYQALAAIVGTTWGGDMRVNIGMPNLGGRVVVGSGRSPVSGYNYVAGQYGGAESVALTATQLPQHVHGLTAATVNTSKMTATTTLSGLTATTTIGTLAANTTLGNLTGTVSGSSLTLKAANSAAATANPTSGSSLATLSAGLGAKLYSSGTPDTPMSTSSISGSANVSFGGAPATTLTGSPATTISGTATTTLGGTASVSGLTDVAGASMAVSIMSPYLVMNYYIAANGGIFPTRD